MILVTGASGQVGKHLLQALSAKGISTRAWIHSERNKEAVLAAGATEVYIGDLSSYEDAATAMKGIDTVYYICNTVNPKEDEIGACLIELAKEMGNITFIYHSVMRIFWRRHTRILIATQDRHFSPCSDITTKTAFVEMPLH